jgi:hypothetical protein
MIFRPYFGRKYQHHDQEEERPSFDVFLDMHSEEENFPAVYFNENNGWVTNRILTIWIAS